MILALELYEASLLVSIDSLTFPALKTRLFLIASLVIKISCMHVLISYYTNILALMSIKEAQVVDRIES
jgi:hypothetical protein